MPKSPPRAESFAVEQFEYAGIVYPLRNSIEIAVEVDAGRWVYRYTAINLWGQGTNRTEALRDLNENFAYLWQTFAEADDCLLDQKALEIKRALLLIVKQPAGV